MGAKTKISWTDATWGVLRGCRKRVETIDGVKVLSPACKNCYAARVASGPRLSGPGKSYDGLAIIQGGRPQWTGEVRFIEKHLLDPLRWKEPRRIFVNSMSDLFNDKVPWDVVDEMLYVMQKAKWHQFQVLTKYVDNMLAYYQSESYRRELMVRNRHIWWGMSTENQQMFDHRMRLAEKMSWIDTFWLSMEPLLGEVNLARYIRHPYSFDPKRPGACELCGEPRMGVRHPLRNDAPPPNLIKFVVVGGESGPKKDIRSTPLEWFRTIRDQCQEAGIPFHLKQLGQLDCPVGWTNPENFPEDIRIQETPDFETVTREEVLF